MRKSFLSCFLAISIAQASGCQSMDKAQTGAILGGVGGALIGSTMGKGKGKILAVALMAGAGAYVGNRIGNMLDEKDRQSLASRTQELLDQPKGKSEEYFWQSPYSKAKAKIITGDEYEKTEQKTIKRVASIHPASNITIINKPYIVLRNANVRTSPDAQSEKVGILESGTEFTAIGRTDHWILVGRKGVIVGYISDTLVAPNIVNGKSIKPSISIDSMSATSIKKTHSFDLDNLPTTEDNVSTRKICRPVSFVVTSDQGKTEKETTVYCKHPNGTWEMN